MRRHFRCVAWLGWLGIAPVLLTMCGGDDDSSGGNGKPDASTGGAGGASGSGSGGSGGSVSLTCDTTLSSLDAPIVQAELTAITSGGTASDPYVVCLPAGESSWTEQVSWDAPAYTVLKGAGSLTTLGGGDATVITDDFASSKTLLGISTNAWFRLTALTVKGGSGLTKENGLIAIGGASKELRVDHMHIDMQTYSPQNSGKLITFGTLNGVVDHNIFDHAQQGFIHFVSSGGLPNDEAWAAPTDFGGSNFIFLEDNEHNGDEDPTNPGHYMGAITDCHSGGRFVVRYSKIVSLGVGQTHPTGHGAGHDRGCRAHELYGNVVTPAPGFDPASDEPPFTFDYTTAGPVLYWGNSAQGVFKTIFYVNVVRQNDTPYTQTAPPDGWGHCGTEFNGTGSAWDGNQDPVTGYPCVDQPGRGAGDLLTGDFPNEVNSTTGTIAWPNQKLEPIYEWSNQVSVVSGWGDNWFANLSNGRIAENRDIYFHYGNTQCSAGAANCGAGVGAGTRGERPANCTQGVAWWSTDQGGNWHTLNDTPNDGALDLCTATNTWADGAYTPYEYPHPLVK